MTHRLSILASVIPCLATLIAQTQCEARPSCTPPTGAPIVTQTYPDSPQLWCIEADALVSDALTTMGYASNEDFVDAIAAMDEQSRNAEVRRLGGLLEGPSRAAPLARAFQSTATGLLSASIRSSASSAGPRASLCTCTRFTTLPDARWSSTHSRCGSSIRYIVVHKH